MRKYLLRGLIIILTAALYFPANRFLEKKETEFSQPHTFSFQPPIPARFFEVYELDKETFEIELVLISGGFSSWSSEDSAFLMRQTSESNWEITLTMDTGRNPYKYVIYPKMPGKEKLSDYNYTEAYWVEDLNAEDFEDDSFGGLNSVYVVKSTRIIKFILNFILYALVGGLIALSLLEFIVRIFMHAGISLKLKLIIILSIFLVLSNVFFITFAYNQIKTFTAQTQIDKFNMIHGLLLGQGVDFTSLDSPETLEIIDTTLSNFFTYASLREDYNLFSNRKHQIARIGLLDTNGNMILYALEPSQQGFLGYWLDYKTENIEAMMSFISAKLFEAYRESQTHSRDIFPYFSLKILENSEYQDISPDLTGETSLKDNRFFQKDIYLYPIYYNYQLSGYYLMNIYPESYSRIFKQILFMNILLIILFTCLFFLVISQIGEIILEPLHKVIEGINRIQEGNYDYEISVKTHDEIEKLGASYNFMREYLLYSRKKVDHYTRHLEEVVDERTTELTVANEKLKELDKLKTQFFANVSHDLRTPLTLILAPAEQLLGKDAPSPDEVSKHTTIIRSNALRLLKLINNLLEISKLEAGKLNPQFTETNIIIILKFLISTLSSAAESRNLSIQFITREEEINAYVDREMFEKIIMNLLSNAFKFTPRQGSIKIEAIQSDKDIKIKISDNGVGIPENRLNRIFERFAQADSGSKREFEGSGIGLSLVKELTELHHGTISVSSIPGKGSEFTVTIPRGSNHLNPDNIILKPNEMDFEIKDTYLNDFYSQTNNDDNENIPENERNESEDINLSTVLIIDDNSDMRHFLSSLLHQQYRTITAQDGHEGLRFAKKYLPDIIISDVMMPKMTGYELCSAVKSDSELKHIPVILLTAKTGMNGKLEGLKYGADDYLSKPFNSTELLARVKNLLKNRLLETQLRRRQKEIDRDLYQASLVQSSILTSQSTYAGLPNIEIDVRYLPMTNTVSGDYYHIAPLKSGIASVIVADTAGHGLQAALSTMQLDVLTRESLLIINRPSERLQYINHLFVAELKTRNFLTAFNIDLYNDKIVYSSAGHPDQYLYKKDSGELVSLKAHGRAIGFFEDNEYELNEHPVNKGDIMILFSDGLIEEFSITGEEYGEGRLISLLKSTLSTTRPNISMRELNDMLLKDVADFHDTEPVNDDITLLAVKWI